ncbi:MAG: hypothetical protein ACOYNN_10105 [Terrimicrobiaceae bacterium]
MSLPWEFRERIRRHNLHAVTMAILSLIGAWLTWLLAYGLVVGLVMGFLTVVDGQAVLLGEKLLGLPWWIHPGALLLAAILLGWAALDERVKRYKPVDDRPVIGWHIFPDIVLTPARMTFGIWNHMTAVIRLSAEEKLEAFDLLRHICAEGKCSESSLGAFFPNLPRLRKILTALQLVGWIDLHRSDDEGFYLVRSDELESVREMISEADEAPTET